MAWIQLSWLSAKQYINILQHIKKHYFADKGPSSQSYGFSSSHLWMEEPGRLQSMGSRRVGHDWATSLSRIGEGNGNHSSILAWRIPGTREPGGLPSIGSHRVGHNWSDLAAAAAYPNYCLGHTSKNIHSWNSNLTGHLVFLRMLGILIYKNNDNKVSI